MSKYIDFGLDMEFSNDGFDNDDAFIVTKLHKVTNFNNKYIYHISNGIGYEYCRLRPNCIHYWGDRSNDNPIPDNTEYRYWNDLSKIWSDWFDYRTANIPFIAYNVIMFEIRYIEPMEPKIYYANVYSGGEFGYVRRTEQECNDAQHKNVVKIMKLVEVL